MKTSRYSQRQLRYMLFDLKFKHMILGIFPEYIFWKENWNNIRAFKNYQVPFRYALYATKSLINQSNYKCALVKSIHFSVATLPHTKCVRTYKKLGCFAAKSKPLDELLITDRDLKSPKSDGHKLNWKEWEQSIHRFEVYTVLRLDWCYYPFLEIDLGPIHALWRALSCLCRPQCKILFSMLGRYFRKWSFDMFYLIRQ